MAEFGKFVAIVGLILFLAGLAIWRFPLWFRWIGRLPGDLSFHGENFSFSFPLVTCLLLSLVTSGIVWLIQHFNQR